MIKSTKKVEEAYDLYIRERKYLNKKPVKFITFSRLYLNGLSVTEIALRRCEWKWVAIWIFNRLKKNYVIAYPTIVSWNKKWLSESEMEERLFLMGRSRTVKKKHKVIRKTSKVKLTFKQKLLIWLTKLLW